MLTIDRKSGSLTEMRSDRTLKSYYREINTVYFLNELPDNVCVRWAEDEDEEPDFASTDFGHDGRNAFEIILNREKNEAASVRLQSLVHEMVHVATGLKDSHGPAFDRWHKILTERGLFKRGALLRNITLF